MKKLFSILVALLSGIMSFAQTGFTQDDINYVVTSSNTVAVGSASSGLKRVVIPETVTYNGTTYRVTALAERSFEGRSDLTYLSIPSSVSTIGEYSFIDCGSNINVNIVSLEEWCKVVFGNEHASPLSSAKAFYLNDVEVKHLEIPYGVTSISGYAFYQCRSITSLSLPSTVASIGSSAFEDCTGLTSIDIENGLNYIGGSSFEGCTGISSITIPSSVTFIALNAFRRCNNLNDITSEIERPFAIEENVFSTYSTATLTVPAGTKSAYQSTKGWKDFRQITEGQYTVLIADSYTREYGEANPDFSYTVDGGSIDGTPTIYCAATVASPVGTYPIKISKGNISNENVELIDGTLTITKATLTITANSYTRMEGELNPTFAVSYEGFKNDEAESVLTKKPNVTTAADSDSKPGIYDINVSGAEAQNYSFNYIKGTLTVTEKTNPTFGVDGINYIGDKSSLTAEVKSVDSNIRKVIIPESISYNGTAYRVVKLAERSFEGRSDISYLSIPSSVTSIGEYAFIDCGSNIDVNINSLETWCDITFANEHSSPLSSAKAFYLNDVEVKDLEIPAGVTSISKYAFYQCKSIISLSIPGTVTSISSSAFEDCTGLQTVSLSNGLTSISGSAFEGCTSLVVITLPGSISDIAINAFKECPNLNVIISEILHPFVIDGNVFSTYSTATLTVPYGTKALYQSTAGWNNFSKIIDGTESKDFTIDGITFETTTSEAVSVKTVDKSLVSIEVPASVVSYDGTTYQVTGIDENAFAGSCMAALILNADFPLSEKTISNANVGSNFLLYVKLASYAPSSVKNVVVDGMAKTIVLSDDGGRFYCPQTFVAQSISYTHNYSMETGKEGMGWETIVLPFNVQRVTHISKGVIVPFASYSTGSSEKPYWLANFSGNNFRRASAIKANEPYIIAMPNSSKYKSDYILTGDVTFSSENAQVIKTPTFNGTFLPTYEIVPKASSVHALNVNNHYVKYSGNYDAGSRFIANLRDVRPFEAYISESSTRGVYEINFDEGTTNIFDIQLSTDESKEIIIHTLNGQRITRTTQRNFDVVWQQLPRGVYIVNGKKRIK